MVNSHKNSRIASETDNTLWEFSGFISPNTTQVPDEVFDVIAPRLKEAELRVLLYIIRRTFGFKKESDNISLKQMVEGITTKEGKVLDVGTGLSKPAVTKAVQSLVKHKIVIATAHRSSEKGFEPTTYKLNMQGSTFRNESRPLLTKLTRGSKRSLQGDVNKVNTQHTVLQQTDIQHRNSNSKLVKNESNHNKGYQDFKAVGELLKSKSNQKEISFKELPEQIKVAIDEISREFGEERNIHSNLVRLIHIIQRSGRNPNNFTSYLYEARSITKQQGGVKKKIPYFFKVLEDLSGIKNL